MRSRIVLLARCPRACGVKTRLAATIGSAPALALYRAFLEDQLAFLGSFGKRCEREWCADGEPESELARSAERAGVRLTLQVEGDLGARMLEVLRRADAEGVTATVLVGADSPTLPARLVQAALVALASDDGVVVVPADDGGYALLGLRRPVPALLLGIPWGGPLVLERTRERAARLGLPWIELERWYDVDDEGGLRRLCAELSRPAGQTRAPATARRILDLGFGRVV